MQLLNTLTKADVHAFSMIECNVWQCTELEFDGGRLLNNDVCGDGLQLKYSQIRYR